MGSAKIVFVKKLKTLFLGPAGAGKGTQAAKVAEEFNFAHISTGDLIRSEIKSGSELGNKVKSIVESGQLVSDDIVNEIVKSSVAKLESSDDFKGFILDGYPRTLGQAQFFDTYSKFDFVFNFEVPREILIQRLTGRRICAKAKDPNCAGTFHLVFNKPKEDGVCDLCGSPLIQRKDDQLEAIEKRLATYDTETGAPLVEYYNGQSNLTSMNADRAPNDVYSDVKASLEKHLTSA